MTLREAPPASDIDVEKDSVRLEPIHGLYGPADPEAAVKTYVLSTRHALSLAHAQLLILYFCLNSTVDASYGSTGADAASDNQPGVKR